MLEKLEKYLGDFLSTHVVRGIGVVLTSGLLLQAGLLGSQLERLPLFLAFGSVLLAASTTVYVSRRTNRLRDVFFLSVAGLVLMTLVTSITVAYSIAGVPSDFTEFISPRWKGLIAILGLVWVIIGNGMRDWKSTFDAVTPLPIPERPLLASDQLLWPVWLVIGGGLASVGYMLQSYAPSMHESVLSVNKSLGGAEGLVLMTSIVVFTWVAADVGIIRSSLLLLGGIMTAPLIVVFTGGLGFPITLSFTVWFVGATSLLTGYVGVLLLFAWLFGIVSRLRGRDTSDGDGAEEQEL